MKNADDIDCVIKLGMYYLELSEIVEDVNRNTHLIAVWNKMAAETSSSTKRKIANDMSYKRDDDIQCLMIKIHYIRREIEQLSEQLSLKVLDGADADAIRNYGHSLLDGVSCANKV